MAHTGSLRNPAAGNLHQPASVTARINYSLRQPGKELYTYIGEKPDHLPSHSNVERSAHEVQIRNLGHPDSQSFKPTLVDNGFTVVPFKVPEAIDWQNSESVQALYWPAVERLIKEHTGASRVVNFDHTRRKGDILDGTEGSDQMQKYDTQGRRPPVARAHVGHLSHDVLVLALAQAMDCALSLDNYTVKSGIARLHELLPEEAERLQRTPFAIVQVWRPTRGPVDSSPLAMIDAASVAPEDLLPNVLHLPGRTGNTYALAYNPEHRWYYKKGLQEDEAYLFVCYDSRADRARFTPHTGFRDPTTAADAFERESAEARAYAFFENEPAQEPAREVDPTGTFYKPAGGHS